MTTYKSFNEWSGLGYKIKKGSKATWMDNVAMFSLDQVQKTSKPEWGNQYKDGSPYSGPSYHWAHINGNNMDDYMNL